MKRRPALSVKLKLREVVPVLKSSADNRMSFYVRAVRYRCLLYFVAHRVLGNPDRAIIVVENCLSSAAHNATTFDHEGAFRSWLVRLALDESLAILHGRKMPEHRHEDEVTGIRTALLSSR
jgi:DNA-directed RNA polymerase specialized sigma24 family protein